MIGASLVTLADRLLAVQSPAYAHASGALPLLLAWAISVLGGLLFGTIGGATTALAVGIWHLLVSLANPDLRGPLRSLTDEAYTLTEVPRYAIMIAVASAVGRLQDLATTNRAQAMRLEERERRFRALTETVSDVIAIFGTDGRATYASPSHRHMLGREPQTLLGQPASFVYGSDEIDEAIADCVASSRTLSRVEMRARHRDGTLRVIDVVLRNGVADSAIGGVVVSGRDVTERKAIEVELARQARFDHLTGLPNRRHLREQLEAEVLAARRTRQSLSVLFLDLDGFKYVNDVLGHEWGDTLLEIVASRLRARMRDNDIVARLGGDEFAVVLPGLDVTAASAVAERIASALTVPYQLNGQTIIVGASIGIALLAGSADAQTLLRQADIAMYGAKRRRAGIRIFSDADDEQVANRLMTASSLQDAIAEDRLVLHFQPQLRIGDASIVGVEALLRWEHPERGLLPPAAFIPIAEELGMMGRLTEWVLRTGLRQLKRWQRHGYVFRMAVNLSAQDLRDPRLAETVVRLLAAYDIPAERLCVEITETAVTADVDRALEFLCKLAEIGVRISIDDFGTGYSSLALLRRFPVSELKIDRTFVIGMENDADDAAIVASTIELAHRLSVDVVVEGVERRTTQAAVARLGADIAQGHSIGEPMTAEDFERWFALRPKPSAISA